MEKVSTSIKSPRRRITFTIVTDGMSLLTEADVDVAREITGLPGFIACVFMCPKRAKNVLHTVLG